jgi:hypothetical protein
VAVLLAVAFALAFPGDSWTAPQASPGTTAEVSYPSPETAYAQADVVVMVENRWFLEKWGKSPSLILKFHDTRDSKGLQAHFSGPFARLIKFPPDSPKAGQWTLTLELDGKQAEVVRKFSADYEISTLYLKQNPGQGYGLLRIGELDQEELVSLIASQKMASPEEIARKYREADWALYSVSRKKMFADIRNADDFSFIREVLETTGKITRADLAQAGIRGRWMGGRWILKASRDAAEMGGEDIEIQVSGGKTILSGYAGLIDAFGKRGPGYLANSSTYDNHGKLLEEYHRDSDDSK